MTTSLQVGVDIGGTFTDVVSRNSKGELRYFKVPTTRKDESIAVLESLKRLAAEWQIEPSAIERFAHGTTVATNAVLERKGAKIGLITTDGFRDVLEIGRQLRTQMYDMILKPETPGFLVSRSLRKEVRERIGSKGEVLLQLDEVDLLRAARELVDAGVEAIVVCFLFSFANADHEQRARDLIHLAHPGVVLTVSHEVNPTYREYERTVVTCFDAYVKPVIDRYLTRLESGLEAGGLTVPLQVMQSRGGLMVSSIARQRPVRLFLSGPAAGVVGAQICGETAGFKDIITVDVGGTSCDIAVISNGRALVRAEGLIDGYAVRVPMVDVNSIGSGGGSIAWLDAGGGLKVGPHSAGSEPGPACFGRGGSEPTVTDASMVLGYLNPDYFAGGALTLSPDASAQAIQEKVARPLNLSLDQAALGVHRIVNAQMAEGIRAVSTRQGLDPRNFALMPLGGGGAIHAAALAKELGMHQVVIPRFPGVLAAAGLLAAPIDHEVTVAFGKALSTIDLAMVRQALEPLDRRCSDLMAAEGIGDASVSVQYFADVCYIGQGYWLEVPLHLDCPDALEQLYREFLEQHRVVYGHCDETPARIINLRSVHRAGGSDRIDTSAYKPVEGPKTTGSRRILVQQAEGFVEATIYRREALPAGFSFLGPAIVEQSDTTILVPSEWNARIDDTGTLILDAP